MEQYPEKKHITYESAQKFVQAIQNGDIYTVQHSILRLDNHRNMILSANPIYNIRYQFTIWVTVISTFCVECGLPVVYAHFLCSLTIQKAYFINTVYGIQLLFNEVTMDYTCRMHHIAQHAGYSKKILPVIEYVLTHWTQRMTVIHIAERFHWHPHSLSYAFQREVGVSLAVYIRQYRLQIATDLLKYSDFPAYRISRYLHYSSHSHFIKLFKKQYHCTPTEYRNRFFYYYWL